MVNSFLVPENRRKILLTFGALYALKTLVKWTQFYFQFQKQKKFCSRYKSNPDLGFLGYLPHMKEFMGNDDAFYEYRYDLYKKLDTKMVATQNGFEFKLDICDVEMAKFFLGIPATSVSKLPLTKEIFKSDRNGFHNSILCADGTKWQQQRKRLSKMLHLDILNDYIEPMDISAVRFCEELCRDDGLKSTTDVFKMCQNDL